MSEPRVDAHVRGGGHVPALDGLRALAIVVVIVHNTGVGDLGPSLAAKVWTQFVTAGWIGVQLFFALSGFLITSILLRSRGRPKALRTFYLRRSLRIFPLYYVFLLVRFALVPLVFPALAVAVPDQLPYWLYVSNWSALFGASVTAMQHFWSLAVEEQFYLVWPALALRLNLRTFAWACGVIAVAALGARIAMHLAGWNEQWMYSATFARADALALGALIAIAQQTPRGRAIHARVRRPLVWACAVALLVVTVRAHGLLRHEWLIDTAGYTLLAVLCAELVAETAAREGGWWQRALAHPALRLVGTYSYALYVFHLPVRYALLDLTGDTFTSPGYAYPVARDVALVGLVFAISFALAAVSYAVLERPLLRLKDRVAPT